MANTFKSYTKTGGSTAANTDLTVYTVPASTTTIIIGLTISNLTNNSITADVKLENVNGDNIHIGKNLPIPSGSSLNALTGKVVMETGDILKVQSDTVNSADIALSIMEVT
jgi:outer membrane protein assembly factor BamA